MIRNVAMAQDLGANAPRDHEKSRIEPVLISGLSHSAALSRSAAFNAVAKSADKKLPGQVRPGPR